MLLLVLPISFASEVDDKVNEIVGLAEAIDSVVNAARNFDESGDERFLEEISSLRSKIEAINWTLNEAYYHDADDRRDKDDREGKDDRKEDKERKF